VGVEKLLRKATVYNQSPVEVKHKNANLHFTSSDRPETTARVLDRLEQSSGRVACRFLLANLRRANKRFLLADFSRLYFRFCDAIGAWQNQSALRYTPFVLIIHQLMGNIRIFFLNCVGFVVVENSSHIYTTFIVVYMHIMARPSFETITKTV
jgi:hypothetical protein